PHVHRDRGGPCRGAPSVGAGFGPGPGTVGRHTYVRLLRTGVVLTTHRVRPPVRECGWPLPAGRPGTGTGAHFARALANPCGGDAEVITPVWAPDPRIQGSRHHTGSGAYQLGHLGGLVEFVDIGRVGNASAGPGLFGVHKEVVTGHRVARFVFFGGHRQGGGLEVVALDQNIRLVGGAHPVLVVGPEIVVEHVYVFGEASPGVAAGGAVEEVVVHRHVQRAGSVVAVAYVQDRGRLTKVVPGQCHVVRPVGDAHQGVVLASDEGGTVHPHVVGAAAYGHGGVAGLDPQSVEDDVVGPLHDQPSPGQHGLLTHQGGVGGYVRVTVQVDLSTHLDGQ